METKEFTASDLRPSEFEERRGISRISVERDYAQVHISRIPAASLMHERMAVLSLIAIAGISIRFPALTPSGLSFLVAERDTAQLHRGLECSGKHFSIKTGRCIVSVHSCGTQEDDGLIARIVGEALVSHVGIDLIADTHNRTMIVVNEADATLLLERLNPLIIGPHLQFFPQKRVFGTEVLAKNMCRGLRRTGLNHTGKLVYMQFDLNAIELERRAIVEASIYKLLGQSGVNVFLIYLSPTSTGFSIPANSLDWVDQLLFSALTGGELRMVFRRACTMVSLVGRDYVENPGVLEHMLKILWANGIEVLQTNDGDRSLSCLVPEDQAETAVRSLSQLLAA